MGPIAALTLLANAATLFAPTPTPRLAAGAELVRPVAPSDAPPFEYLSGAIPMRAHSDELRLTGARDPQATGLAYEDLPLS